jgi:flagellar biosynthetic protein FliP
MRITGRSLLLRACLVTLPLLAVAPLYAQTGNTIPVPKIEIGFQSENEPQQIATGLQILALLTVLSLAPALLIMTTAFTRIVIVLSFLRTALGTPTIPPNPVLIGLSLFLTFYVMTPTWERIQKEALQPYLEKEIPLPEATGKAWDAMRDFMIRQTYEKDLSLFAKISNTEFRSVEDVGWRHLIPAFILSELKTAFLIGFYIFVPFLVIDLIVASTLMSMGMMMLPPALISLPAKILVFVLADGWTILIQALLGGFR